MGLRNLTVSLTLLVTATLLASIGALKVSIKEYDVPTPKARPHDPAVSPDGALWVTEQMANKLGRLDPNTRSLRNCRDRGWSSGLLRIRHKQAGQH